MIEAAVERHLIRRVKEVGGEVRKVAWPGRRHAPDRLVLLPERPFAGVGKHVGRHALVELKRPGEKPTRGQLREHERLRAAGFEVVVLTTKHEVDVWVDDCGTIKVEWLR